jgi:hypothetical protein
MEHLHQLDITNAFLHDHIFKEVCMDQPPSYIDPQFSQNACHLRHVFLWIQTNPLCLVPTL